MNGDGHYLFGYCQDRSISCLLLRPRFREEVRRGTALFERGGHWTDGHIS